MHNHVEHLDEVISVVLSGQMPENPKDEHLRALFETAADLRFLAHTEFRARLRADLLGQASLPAGRRHVFEAGLPTRSLRVQQSCRLYSARERACCRCADRILLCPLPCTLLLSPLYSPHAGGW